VLLEVRSTSLAHELVSFLEQLAERLLDAVAQPVEYAGHQIQVAASIGVRVSARAEAKAGPLVREADSAMYAAKSDGGGRVRVVHGGPVASEESSIASVDDSLRRALDAREFRVHYQPIVRLDGGQVVSVEALIRWQHPDRGLLTPNRFLPAAEANGMIVELGGWVLGEACRQLARWDEEAGPASPRYVNVNVSVGQLTSHRLAGQVSQALVASGLDASRLRLELPETATLDRLRSAAGVLRELRDRGVQLTLDDVGSGANSLRHLTSIDVDGIKIDQSFVSTMLDDRRDMAVVRMLIELGDALGIAVTAEGVETVAQRDALLTLGCRFAQGYLFGRPLPPDRIDLVRGAGVPAVARAAGR
jgi:EAL domain-containing protein (putative c-di-GMP-specific phosphodiesterase class I)